MFVLVRGSAASGRLKNWRFLETASLSLESTFASAPAHPYLAKFWTEADLPDLRMLAFFACLVLGSPAARAQQVEPDIVVEGSRLGEMVRSFVAEVATAPVSERQMARWDQSICPMVAGLPERQSQYIADRIAARARGVGIRTRRPGCRAGILILITPDADQLAEVLVRTNRDYMGYFGSNGLNNLGRAALDDFTSSSAPVRWWHVNETVTIDGQRLGREASIPEVHTTTPLSRLRRTTRQDLSHVVIIVDAKQADGVMLQALADYLAMISLAQIDPGAAVENIPTILRLFDEVGSGSAPSSLTEWDLAYLDGLYNAQRAAPNDHWQRRDIVRRMLRSITPAP